MRSRSSWTKALSSWCFALRWIIESPARYGDTIEIETWVRDITRATMVFEHIMREKTSQRVFVECRAKVVYVDVNGKPKRLPAEYVENVK